MVSALAGRHTVIVSLWTICWVSAHVEHDALDRDQCRAVRIRALKSIVNIRSRNNWSDEMGEEDGGSEFLELQVYIPSHFDSSSIVIGSSFGGSSWTGTLGLKRSDVVDIVDGVARIRDN